MAAEKVIRRGRQARVKYGPVTHEAMKHGKEPARQFAQRQIGRLNARKQALSDAEGRKHGSAMPICKDDEQVWIVFNGESRSPVTPG